MYNSQITKFRIKELCKAAKISEEKVLTQCELGTNAIRQINDKKGMASYSLAKIADVLNCSVDYLLGRTEASDILRVSEGTFDESQGLSSKNMFYSVKQENAPSVTDEAARIAVQYDSLDVYGKDLINTVMEKEAARIQAVHQDEEEAPKTKVIPLYLTPAAAGYASPALGSDYEEYSVPIESKADFACKIQGDSMEPVIKDGDIVLVKRQIDLEPGDVGLFYVDGDMKCKQYCEDCYGNIYLFSLNRERSDADVTIWASSGISVFCFGKVILDKRPPLPRD